MLVMRFKRSHFVCAGPAALVLYFFDPASGCAQQLDPGASSSTVEATAVIGHRADENALRTADDGFGTVVGRESVGIYKASIVRGFSPVAAGNVRLDGLYFDQVIPIDSHLVEATNIRVGVSALGIIFPSPTGIVDTVLRKPDDAPALSLFISADDGRTSTLEADINQPLIADRLRLAAGFTINHFNDFNGTRSNTSELAASARWTPGPWIDIMPFWSRERQSSEDSVIYLPAGDYLPPHIPQRHFIGPDWARFRGDLINYGLLVTVDLSPAWTLTAGVFRSELNALQEFSNLLVDVTPSGTGGHLVIADPPSNEGATSGEVRLAHAFVEGPRRHRVSVSLRARARDRRFDGSDEIDLGPTTIESRATPPKPVLQFGEQQRDRIRQWTVGIAYESKWKGVGDLAVGVSRSDYRKQTGLPGRTTVSTIAQPILFNVNAVARLTSKLALYAGYVTGLEESGVAPSNAVNRNEPQPAILTSQRDLGMRWSATNTVSLIAGVFDVRKPYYNIGIDGRFGPLGSVVNRGIEASIAGAFTPRLDLVAGVVLLTPRVSGLAAHDGSIGARPIGSINSRFQVNLEWKPAFADGFSVDAKATHQSAQVATLDNRVAIPARTIVDLGSRYSFKLGGKGTTLRVVLSNLFDVQSFNLVSEAAYEIIPGRLATASVTIDF